MVLSGHSGRAGKKLNCRRLGAGRLTDRWLPFEKFWNQEWETHSKPRSRLTVRRHARSGPCPAFDEDQVSWWWRCKSDWFPGSRILRPSQSCDWWWGCSCPQFLGWRRNLIGSGSRVGGPSARQRSTRLEDPKFKLNETKKIEWFTFMFLFFISRNALFSFLVTFPRHDTISLISFFVLPVEDKQRECNWR